MITVDINKIVIDQLPENEDDYFEYKSSSTPIDKLKDKLQRGVSGFANSGGRHFIVGISDKTGKADGGIPQQIGRQSLRDWVDIVLHQIDPTPKYSVRLIDDIGERGILNESCVILVIAVEESYVGPHMAPDGYFIRAGAHTERAKHFIVEAIRAKRYQSKPKLTHLFRLKPNKEQVLQLGILGLTDAPAIDTSIYLLPIPKILERREKDFPIKVPIIDRKNPYFFDISLFDRSDENFGNNITLKLEYSDISSNKYEQESIIGVENSTPPIKIGNDYPAKTLKVLESIEKAIVKVNSNKDRNYKYTVLPSTTIDDIFGYVSKLLPELLSEMRQDLFRQPFVREFIIIGKHWVYNSNPNNDIFEYYFEEHSYLRSKLRILENCGLIYDITYNTTDRFIISEQLAIHLRSL